MFDNSVAFSTFTAGSGVDAVETRVRQLESIIQAVNTQKSNNLSDIPSFKSYIEGVNPPPKVKPIPTEAQPQAAAIQPLVEKYANQYGVDKDLINAVIRQESGFNPNAVSHAGAQGLMQLMPQTAKNLGITNSFDAQQNLEGGIRHLSGLMSRYNGNIPLALAAYNAGGGAVDKFHGIPPYPETQQYVRKILAAYLQNKNQPASAVAASNSDNGI